MAKQSTLGHFKNSARTSALAVPLHLAHLSLMLPRGFDA